MPCRRHHDAALLSNGDVVARDHGTPRDGSKAWENHKRHYARGRGRKEKPAQWAQSAHRAVIGLAEKRNGALGGLNGGDASLDDGQHSGVWGSGNNSGLLCP